MKRLVFHGIFSLLVIVALIASCKKDQPVQPLNEGYSYFPNNVGHYVIYNVDSLVLNLLYTQPIDTFKYQIKEIIDSIFPDASGRPTQRIVRYKRTDTTQPWVIEKVWSGNLTATTGERVEDNERYIRLVFPININAIWNGNAYNTLGTMNYQYTSLDKPYAINNTHFDSTLIVLQDSNINLVQHQFYLERYARNVGRIYKVIIDLSSSNIVFALNQPYLVVTDSLMKQLNGGSVVYSETYVTSGN